MTTEERGKDALTTTLNEPEKEQNMIIIHSKKYFLDKALVGIGGEGKEAAKEVPIFKRSRWIMTI